MVPTQHPRNHKCNLFDFIPSPETTLTVIIVHHMEGPIAPMGLCTFVYMYPILYPLNNNTENTEIDQKTLLCVHTPKHQRQRDKDSYLSLEEG